MHLFSKLAALTAFAAAVATISFAAPSSAQTPPVCCEIATKPIVTGAAGWTLQPPSGPAMTPVVVNPTHPAWLTLPGSKWVSNNANSGQMNEPQGTYVYSYRFCLCDAPRGVQQFPGSLSLNIYADDDFTAYLNGHQIAQKTGGWAFNSPAGGTVVNIASTWFKRCNNVLRFEVHNSIDPKTHVGNPSPTGLDVAGSISGYFLPTPPADRPCPCTEASGTVNPN